ncbi:hypothetical protein WR25_17727 [Diploscapter pachys]|uniref:Uncharacterized protein n=1 Tax=Diploscapter pachys TaxID=2018661 RepID=A0A2A2LPE0_9BILA|nr:hypothetical protein WR25_17727 [Diploscapter pachys]
MPKHRRRKGSSVRWKPYCNDAEIDIEDSPPEDEVKIEELMPFVKDDLPKVETSSSGGRLDVSIDSDTGDELEEDHSSLNDLFAKSSDNSSLFQNESVQSDDVFPFDDSRMKVKLRRKTLHPIAARFEQDLRVVDSVRVTAKHDRFLKTGKIEVVENLSAFGATFSLLSSNELMLRPVEVKKRRSSALSRTSSRLADSPSTSNSGENSRIENQDTVPIIEILNVVLPMPSVDTPRLGTVYINPVLK